MKFAYGERYPLLLSGDGAPHFDVTLFATSQIRNSSAKPNTIYAVLSSVRYLLGWLQAEQIDLAVRIRDCKFLSDSELDSLSTYVSTLRVDLETVCSNNVVKPTFRRRSEQVRAAPCKSRRGVSAKTKYGRLTYIADYIVWFANRFLETSVRGPDRAFEQLGALATAILARRPKRSTRSKLDRGRALAEDAQRELFELIRSDSPRNPFQRHVRSRNALIIRLTFDLGIRAGELLALKASDFDFSKNEVVIARRHDDMADPREHQPVAKTIDRRLPLSHDLTDAVMRYVTKDRRLLSHARRHPFLLVVHQPGPYLGRPLSQKGLGKMFESLREASAKLLADFSCHSLRHTANERFSELMDERGVPASREEKLRSFAMGWKEGSGTAATYTRRHTERLAKEASLNLQRFKRPERRDD